MAAITLCSSLFCIFFVEQIFTVRFGRETRKASVSAMAPSGSAAQPGLSPRPGGGVKAANQRTIALQQGDGDWKTSIRGAPVDAKWLRPISPGGVVVVGGCAEPGKALMK